MMPDRSYEPLHDPPSRLDHFKAHLDRVILSVTSVGVGALVVAAVFIDGFVPSSSVESLALGPSLAVGGLLGAGGVMTLWGTITTHAEMRTVWNVLRTGLLALATGWLAYALTVLAIHPSSVIPWLSSLGLSTLWAASFWVTRRGESYLRGLLGQTRTA